MKSEELYTDSILKTKLRKPLANIHEQICPRLESVRFALIVVATKPIQTDEEIVINYPEDEDEIFKGLCLNYCFGCRDEKENLFTCSRCKTALYCSKECQKGHWPKHKESCLPVSKSTLK